MKNPKMVDVGEKPVTRRTATAQVFVKLDRAILKRIRDNDVPKGNVLETARIAGILAAKNTAGLIPLCHNIELEYADFEFRLKSNGILVESTVRATAKTGVEMEAMTACSIAALTICDMCKMFSRSSEITDLYLLEKKGGKSGTYRRTE